MNLAVPAALLFASGLASLVYQMLWVKQLSLMVGVEVQAITTAVGAFFGGLAVGGYVWGRLADRIRPTALPLRRSRDRGGHPGCRCLFRTGEGTSTLCLP